MGFHGKKLTWGRKNEKLPHFAVMKHVVFAMRVCIHATVTAFETLLDYTPQLYMHKVNNKYIHISSRSQIAATIKRIKSKVE